MSKTRVVNKYLNNVSCKDCVGKVCKSKSSGDFKIVKYNDSKDVDIQFLKTGYETVTRLDHIRNGNVKDPYLPSVFGVGILGTKYLSTVNGVKTKEYMLWCDMLRRCYSDDYKKRNQTYIDCEVGDKFKSYEYFYEWCNKQVGFTNEGWHLDKDLLIKGSKVYSESTCVFLPQEINKALTKSDRIRGKYPIGVCLHSKSKSFVAQVNKNKGKRRNLGYFKTEIEAFNAYKQAKETFIKEQANKWKDKIDDRAYNALINYEVNIDD